MNNDPPSNLNRARISPALVVKGLFEDLRHIATDRFILGEYPHWGLRAGMAWKIVCVRIHLRVETRPHVWRAVPPQSLLNHSRRFIYQTGPAELNIIGTRM